MNLFDLRPENEELVLRRIEVFLSRKLKKKFPLLNSLTEAAQGAFLQDEKTIVTPAKNFAARTSTVVHPVKRRKPKSPKAGVFQRNFAILGFLLLVVLILWWMLF